MKIINIGLAIILVMTAALLLFVNTRFKTKYVELIEKNAKTYSINISLVQAVIWTESKYKSDAKSGAGAIGLMQLMPETAKWCAENIGIEYDEAMLIYPDYNIKLGTYYLSYLFDKFKCERLAVIAYNAGEGNVAKWLASNENFDIPFKETRDYLSRVNFAKKIYKWF